MGSLTLFQFIAIGVILVTGRECQEAVALNMPSRSPFFYHSPEELSMDLSEIHPVFLYASSQNDFIHQNLPEHMVPNPQRPSHQHQSKPVRPKYTNIPSPIQPNARYNKHGNNPSLTYGFNPKPSGRRPVNNHQIQKKGQPNLRKNQENQRFIARQQSPVYQGTVRHENQHQNKYFSESVQVQKNAHHIQRQNPTSAPNLNYQSTIVDYNQPFNYLSHILPHEKQFYSQAVSERPRPNRNSGGHRTHQVENRKPFPSQSYGNHQVKEEHRQESVRKHVTFEDTAKAFKEKFNHHDVTVSSKTTPNRYTTHSLQEKGHNNDERLNLQHYSRSMHGENKPQLPPRPSFNNGGFKINTQASQLPVLHVDSASGINENHAVYLQGNNQHENPLGGEQEKKTYILFKAPHHVTTESPSSEPFIVEALQHTSSPFYLNNFAETKVHVPELTYSTPVEPRAIPDNNIEAPIVLDLVQIPDHATYSPPPEQPVLHTSEFRSTHSKDRDLIENMPPTESYPTTPMRQYSEIRNHQNDVYSILPDDNADYQTKTISKPKIKDFKKPSNISSFQPISYSSSVSIVSVKQSVDAKQSPAKKQKATLKKALSSRKKAKYSEYDDLYDDYDGGANVPGEAGKDYPTYKDIPTTSFDCKHIKAPGFYADIETRCQVFHNCDTGMYKHSFMCPNGTIFHQELLICDWWYNVKCEDSPEFYSLNSGLFITNNAHDSRKKA